MKKTEAVGFDGSSAISTGLKHAQAKDLVARFTAEVARPLLTTEPRTTAELRYKAVTRLSRQSNGKFTSKDL